MLAVQHQNSCVNGTKFGFFSNSAPFKQSRFALRGSLPDFGFTSAISLQDSLSQKFKTSPCSITADTNSSVTNISALLGRTAHTKNWRLETYWLSKDTLTLCTHFVGFLPSKQIKQIFCNSTRSSFLHCKQNVTKECSLVL